MHNILDHVVSGEVVFVAPGFDGSGGYSLAPKGSRVFSGEVEFVEATDEQIALISKRDEQVRAEYDRAVAEAEAERDKILAGAFEGLTTARPLTADEAMALGARPSSEK